MERFCQLGRPIVCIHDSFRVWLEDVELLKQFMIEEFQKACKGFSPRLKVVEPPKDLPDFPKG